MKHYCNFRSILNKTVIYSVFALSFFVLISCDADSDGKEVENQENDQDKKNEKNPEIDPKWFNAEPITLRIKEKADTDNAFAFDLFRVTYGSTDDANVFMSPLSVNMALSMTLNGAKGATLEEMKNVLRAKKYSLDDINEYNKSLREALMDVDPHTTLSIANSIWHHNTVTVKNSFALVNKEYYNAVVKALDFNSPDAVDQINSWVSEQTNNKIPRIMDRISADNKMCLINAVSFGSEWGVKFDKDSTRKEDFYSEDNVSMGRVNMMCQTGRFLYSEDENSRYIRLYYGNGAFSMIVMLPQEGRTVEDVVTNLSNESWNAAMDMEAYVVNLHFPRFNTDCSYDMEKAILPELGMEMPFSDNADFGDMADQSFKIYRVIHKTFVNVDEDGTEAAASTVVIAGDAASGGEEQLKFVDYVVNKPFAFAIRENSTGIILFMGKIGHVK